MTHLLFLGVALLVALALFRLLRDGRIREKYAALWILIGTGIVVLAAWPGLLNGLTELIGVAVPANLLFFLAIMLLLGVTLHLSLEASRLEDETRVLAEQVAMLSVDLRDLRGEVGRAISAAGDVTPPAELDGIARQGRDGD